MYIPLAAVTRIQNVFDIALNLLLSVLFPFLIHLFVECLIEFLPLFLFLSICSAGFYHLIGISFRSTFCNHSFFDVMLYANFMLNAVPSAAGMRVVFGYALEILLLCLP